MQITLRQLEIFAAICQQGTITGAARRIGLSQAATSQALAELENQLQRRLFDRHGRRLQQNAAGSELFPHAIEVLDRVRDIERGAGEPYFHIRLCASLTVGNYMLPSFIGRFARRHPGARFQMAIGNTEHVVAAVRQFESDAGWVEGLARDPELRSVAWREDRLVIIAAPNHPLAGRRATAAALAEAAWVLREKGSGTREVFEEAIAGQFNLLHVPVEVRHRRRQARGDVWRRLELHFPFHHRTGAESPPTRGAAHALAQSALPDHSVDSSPEISGSWTERVLAVLRRGWANPALT
jgi:DNA-binding transcriptional LysR family regulator